MKQSLCVCVLLVYVAFAPLTAQEAEDAATTEDVNENDYLDFGADSAGLTVIGETSPPPAVPETNLYGAQHNVVSEEQIREQGSLDFLDTLRDVPGVTTSKHNIIGTNTATSLYIRGRGYTHPSLDTVTNFDGVPRNGLIYGQSMADSLPVFAASGVEVYKSPQPSSFGAGYGMVNVSPKYMQNDGWEALSGFSGGTYATFMENLGAGIKAGRFDAYAAQSWVSTDGHTDHSAAKQQSYYLNLGFAFAKNWMIRALGNLVFAETEQPRRKTDKKDAVKGVFKTNSVFATLTLSDNYEKAFGFVKFYLNNNDFYWLHEAGQWEAWSKQPMTAYGARAKETLRLWSGNEILAGFDADLSSMTNENHQGDYLGQPTKYSHFPDMNLFSPYLAAYQYIGDERKFHITPSAGVRGYLHSVWAHQIAPQAGLVVGYGNTDINLNYSWAVVYPAPAIIQNVVTNNKDGIDNNDLKSIRPETACHYEAGVRHTWPYVATMGASWFYDDGKDRFVSSGGSSASIANEVSTASYFKIMGVEIYISATPTNDLVLFAGGTWLDIHAKSENGKEVTRLPYTPKLSASCGFSWNLWRFKVNGDYQYRTGLYTGSFYTGDKLTAPPSMARLADQHLINLRVAYQFFYERWRIEKTEVFCAVNNLLNRKYAYYLDEEMPGISVMAGLNVTVR
jgi:iron complex outermembrane receptor protein